MQMLRIKRHFRAPAALGEHAGLGTASLIAALLLVAIPALATQAPASTADRAVRPEAGRDDQGDGPTARPEAARRVVRTFDFEEQSSNPFGWPRHWQRAQNGVRARSESGEQVEFHRPGFPSWNLAELDYESTAFTGIGSVMLPTRGGSTALRLEPGVIPVFPDADYLVTAHVRTHGLEHARARVEAVFLDEHLKPIESSRAACEPAASEDSWAPVEIELRGASNGAAFLSLELALLQPQQQGGLIPGYRPPPQDYSGAAWFDDVAVAQLPRIELSCPTPGSVFLSPEKPTLSVDIRDLTGEDLTAQITLIDRHGAAVDRFSREVGAGRAHLEWSPDVPRFGWYRAALGVFNREALVGKAHADFLWLDADPLGISATRRLTPDRGRFGVSIDGAAGSGAGIEPVLRRIGSGSVVLSAWTADLTPGTIQRHVRDLAATTDPLLDHGQIVAFVLPRMPEQLAAITRLDPDDPWSVLSGPRATWGPFLEPILERFGQRVRRWQIGESSDTRAMASKTLEADLLGAERALATLVPSPVLCVPWRAGRDLIPGLSAPGSGRTRVSVLVPHDAPAGTIARTVESWRNGPSGSELEFVLEPAPEDLYGSGTGIADLARRTVELWRAESGAVLQSPWALAGRSGRLVQPRAELGVWSTLARRLSERRIVGEFPAGPGLKCLILAPAPGTPGDAPGALVAWSESAPEEESSLRAYVGQTAATVVDLFGNATAAAGDDAPAPRRAAAGALAGDEAERPTARNRGIRVPLTAEPVFIEGVDATLVRFLSSVRIDPPLLKPTNESHEHAIVFGNPWNTPLEIKSFVASPGGYETPDGTRDRRWRVTPRAGRAVVQPGGEGRIPITVSFAPSEEAGLKEFVLDLEIVADRNYGSVRTTALVELGLPEIMLELVAIRVGRDVVIEAHVDNRGARPMDLELTATAPDQPRSKAPISQLPPGRRAVRRFPYSRGFEAMEGKRVSVAVLEPETGARIVRSVLVE